MKTFDPTAHALSINRRSFLTQSAYGLGGAAFAMLAAAADVALPPTPPAAALESCAPSQANWSVVVNALAATLATVAAPTPSGTIEPFVPPHDFAQRVTSHHAVFGNDDWLWRR